MPSWREHLNAGQVIPACPLALNADGSWSDVHQRALIRYYVDAGAGGLAVGVHSTQFAAWAVPTAAEKRRAVADRMSSVEQSVRSNRRHLWTATAGGVRSRVCD